MTNIVRKSRWTLGLLLIAVLCGFSWSLLSSPKAPAPRFVPYPGGKTYALSLAEDPDEGSLERIIPVYKLLDELDWRVTKTVWVFPAGQEATPEDRDLPCTLQNPDYKNFILALQAKGHEIGMHGVSAGSDQRARILEGFEAFRDILGHDPAVYTAHKRNLENMYFGKNRFRNPLLRLAYGLYDGRDYQGQEPASPYFWGDISRARVRYQREWFFKDLDTLSVHPSMPYHDPQRDDVQYWYSVSDGFDAGHFLKQCSPKRLQALKQQRGAGVLYTHFGLYFVDRATGQLRPEIEALLRRLSADTDLWRVPLSELLDRLLLCKAVRTHHQRGRLVIANEGDTDIPDATICFPAGTMTQDILVSGGAEVKSRRPDALVLDMLPAHSVTVIHTAPMRSRDTQANGAPGLLEQWHCFWQWLCRAWWIR